MFDLRIPESMASLPGRFNYLEDDPVKPKVTHEERLQQMREYAKARKRTPEYRAAQWAYYQRNKAEIQARRKARRVPKVKQTPEERAAQKALYWATNRERINARRRELSAKSKTRTVPAGRVSNQ